MVQRAHLTTDISGLATWTFPIAFTNPPVCTAMFEEGTNNMPLVCKVVSKSTTAVTYQVYRSQALPALSGIILVGPLISALANFNVFNGSDVNNITLHVFAAEKTQ